MKIHFSLFTALLLSGCALPPLPQSCCECSQNSCRHSNCCEEVVGATQTLQPRATQVEHVVLPPVAAQWDPAEAKADNRRLAMLEDDLRKLEAQRRYEMAQQQQLEQSVVSMSERVQRLNTDVVHWRNQVVQLEEEALAQQTLDLESLGKLNNIVEKLGDPNDGR